MTGKNSDNVQGNLSSYEITDAEYGAIVALRDLKTDFTQWAPYLQQSVKGGTTTQCLLGIDTNVMQAVVPNSAISGRQMAHAGRGGFGEQSP